MVYISYQSCLLCHCTSQAALCSHCADSLPVHRNACSLCALPLPASAAAQHLLCGRCLRKPRPISKTVAAYWYGGFVPSLIHAFKFHGHLASGAWLAEQLAQRVTHLYRNDSLPQCLIPVPLHPKRLRERSFNQAAEVAKQIGQTLSVSVALGLMQRHQENAEQIGASVRQRHHNVRRAFHVEGAALKKNGATHVAIIDDVVTSGATCLSMAKHLKHHGVQRIDVWCLARTP